MDTDDFGRCHRLLDAVPSFRPRIGEMKDVSPQWAKLAAAWEELTAIYLEELPTVKMTRLDARMKEMGL